LGTQGDWDLIGLRFSDIFFHRLASCTFQIGDGRKLKNPPRLSAKAGLLPL